MDEKKDIKSLSLDEIKDEMILNGEKAYRASQIYQWLHKRRARSFEGMTDLPAALRSRLEEEYEIRNAYPLKSLFSRKDGTKKYLFGLNDGVAVESVFLPYRHGNSACISSQAGCRMGCRFCASTAGGLERDLLPSELLSQVYEIERNTGEVITHVVLMGSGEPLDNYENVVKFIRLITDPAGRNLSRRNITLSTCGIVPRIIRLADEELQITLAVSLHAADDETRQKLMPVDRKYPVGVLIEACKYYFRQTGRRVTFEYSLVSGVNDSDDDACKLANLLADTGSHVNLIPVNPVSGRSFVPPERQSVTRFMRILEKKGINATIRREMGQDIAGACGQLRGHYLNGRARKDWT